jgi:hypothetical protein
MVLDLVKRWPGRTGYELFELATAEQKEDLENAVQVYRKLNDLRRASLIEQGPPKLCGCRKRNMVTWTATATTSG